jgi:hypothetical protein
MPPCGNSIKREKEMHISEMRQYAVGKLPGLSTRTRNAIIGYYQTQTLRAWRLAPNGTVPPLAIDGCPTPEWIAELGEDGLMKIPMIGRFYTREIKEWLNAQGLYLAPSADDDRISRLSMALDSLNVGAGIGIDVDMFLAALTKYGLVVIRR